MSGSSRILDAIDRWERESIDLIPTFTPDGPDRWTRRDQIERAARFMRDAVQSDVANIDKAAEAGINVVAAFRPKPTGAYTQTFALLAKTPILTEVPWDRALHKAKVSSWKGGRRGR